MARSSGSAKVYVIGHLNPDTDSVVAAIAYAAYKRSLNEGEFVAARAGELNPETKHVLEEFNCSAPPLLDDGAGKELILVDHNEASQSVRNVEEARILEVIDHHKVNFSSKEPLYFHVEPVGATSTIIADFYFKGGLELGCDLAGLLLSGILSDTVVFRSVTTTEKDRGIARRLAELAGVEDLETFGISIKRKKAMLEGLSAERILTSDLKTFEFKGRRVGIAQVEVVDFQEARQRYDEILEAMRGLQRGRGFDLLALMVTNILDEASEVLVVGNELGLKKFEEAFGKLEGNRVYLPGVLSRKGQVVPPLTKVFSG